MLEFSWAIVYERAAEAEALAGWLASVGAFVFELTLAAGTLSAGLEQPAKKAMGSRGSRWLNVFMWNDVFGSMGGTQAKRQWRCAYGVRLKLSGAVESDEPKRQRAAALQDLSELRAANDIREASWSAA